MGSKFIVPLRLLELNTTPALPLTSWHKLYYKGGYLKTLKGSEKDVVLDRPLDGFVAGPCLPITATDTVLEAFQKLQCQITAIPPQVNADWLATSGPALILNKPDIPQLCGNLLSDILPGDTFVICRWNGSSFDTFNVDASSLIPVVPPTLSYGLFNQLKNSTPVQGITNNNGSLFISGPGNSVGSLEVPANTFQEGDGFKLEGAGHLSITGPPPDLTLRVLFNGIPELTITIPSLPNVSDLHWRMEINFTIRSIGATGAVMTAVKFFHEENANDKVNGHSATQLSPLNTTIPNELDITATWTSGDDADIIYSEIMTLSKTY
jgi:hypothetical protein